MGYLPIALALMGFLLLWGMVNYNTVAEKFRAAENIRKEILELWRQKLQLAEKSCLLSEIDGSFDRKTLDDLTSPMAIKAANKTVDQQLAKNVDISQEAPPASEKLFEVSMMLQQRLQAYQQLMHHYNALITSIPTKFISRVGGFKPLPTHA